MSLCQYSEIFGRPGEGVHKERLFGLAAVDVLGTALGAYLLSIPITSAVASAADISTGVMFQVVVTVLLFIVLVVLSLGVHSIFCVETALVKKVAEFSSPKDVPGNPEKESNGANRSSGA